jgi:polyisoprenoid-binding protein YceI
MKILKQFLAAALLIISISAARFINNTYILSNDYSVSISGTSNLHSWDEKVKTVSGEAIVNLNTDKSIDLTALTIRIDVHSIQSDMGSVMNSNTYKALKADINPKIIFTLSTPVKSIQSGVIEKTISVKGNLTVAGITKAVDMQAKVIMHNKQVIFQGIQSLNMTDYGVTPPTALFGTLKTGNTIIIHFTTTFLAKEN